MPVGKVSDDGPFNPLDGHAFDVKGCGLCDIFWTTDIGVDVYAFWHDALVEARRMRRARSSAHV